MSDELIDLYVGDDAALVESIKAMLDLNGKGAMSPRVPTAAVQLLASAAVRLAARAQGPGPVVLCYECKTDSLIGPICGGCNPEIAAMVEGRPGPGEAVAWKAGDPVFVALGGHDDKLTMRGTILRPVEGWWEVRFSDASTAIVRPSRIAATPTREA